MRPEDLVGRSLGGRYRIRRLLGQGGMGVVYEGENIVLGKRVAVKLLSPRFAAAPEDLARFEQEARAAAALGHPNIIEVYDFGREGSRLAYFVMEMLDGRSLAEVVDAEGPLAVTRAVDIAGQTLDGLAAAHHAGIVHRDVKPDNIFLCREVHGAWKGRRSGSPAAEHVKILDFGISMFSAVTRADGTSEQTRRRRMRLTRPGTFLGTAWYVAPEQARGRPDIGPPADTWAVGVVLYEMLAGQPPFDGSNDVEVLFKVLTHPQRPLAQVRPDVPRGLSEVVEYALAKEPGDRFPTAENFAEALVPFAVETTAQARRAAVGAASQAGDGAEPSLPFERTVLAGLGDIVRADGAQQERQPSTDRAERGDRTRGDLEAQPHSHPPPPPPLPHAGAAQRPASGAGARPVAAGLRAVGHALRRATTTAGRALRTTTARVLSSRDAGGSGLLRVALTFVVAVAVIIAGIAVVVAVLGRSGPGAMQVPSDAEPALPSGPTPVAPSEDAATAIGSAGTKDAATEIPADTATTGTEAPPATDVPDTPDAGVDDAKDADAGRVPPDDGAAAPVRGATDGRLAVDSARDDGPAGPPPREDAAQATDISHEPRFDAGAIDAPARLETGIDDGGAPAPAASRDAAIPPPIVPDGMTIRPVRRDISW